MEVLSLIPTHLPSNKDLFHASFVCRRWRRTFIQHAALWSRLDLTIKRSDLFVKTLLERAKLSALDISSARLDCADTLALLSSHAQQFRTLKFVRDCWPYVRTFSEAIPGPLPLLRTLEIDAVYFDFGSCSTIDPEMMGPPSRPFFSGAVNLKNLTLRMRGKKSLFLNHFVFPNLKTFELSVTPHNQPFCLSGLLGFLEASPTLHTTFGRTTTLSRGVSPGRNIPAVILIRIKTFSLTLDKPYCWIAPHVSCSSARSMSFVHEQDAAYEIPQEIFPTPNSWNVICPQNTIDEVVLGMTSLATTPGKTSCFVPSPSHHLAWLALNWVTKGSRNTKPVLSSSLRPVCCMPGIPNASQPA